MLALEKVSARGLRLSMRCVGARLQVAEKVESRKEFMSILIDARPAMYTPRAGADARVCFGAGLAV